MIYRYCLLVVLVLLGMTLGTWQGITTPTLPNLKEKLNVSYESIGRVLSLSSLGNVMALILAGYLYDSFPSFVPYMMFGECLIGGIATIIIPWCNQLWVVAILFYIQSGVHYSLNNGGQLSILTTFKNKSISKMQIYHLGYGIGALLSGLISQPFLPKKISLQTKVTKYCKMKLESQGFKEPLPLFNISNVTTSQTSLKGSFEYIYVMAGVIGIVVSLIFLAFISFRNPMKSQNKTTVKESWLDKIQPKYIANGKPAIGISMTILLFLYYFFYVFGYSSFLPYIVVYAIDPCKEYFMSQKTATYLYSATTGCFLLGRILGSFVLDMNPTLILLLSSSLNVVFVLVLAFFSNKYVSALWIGACGMRFCNSVFYSSGTSYTNRYIIVTSSLISVAFIGGTMGSLVGSITGSYIIDNYASYNIFYLCLILKTLFWITVVTIVILGRKIGIRKFSDEKNSLKNSNMELSKT